MSKSGNYRKGVAWIAQNDQPAQIDDDYAEDPAIVTGYLSVALLSHLYDVPALAVVQDVIEYRRDFLQDAQHGP